MRSRRVLTSLALALLLSGALVSFLVFGPGGGSDSMDLSREGAGGAAETGLQPQAAPEADGGRAPAERETAPEGAAGGVEVAEVAEEDTRPVGIEGKVEDASGAGIPATHVVAVEQRVWTAALVAEKQRLERNPFEAVRVFRDRLLEVARELPRSETDEEGWYRLRGLGDGEYRVFAVREGFLPHHEEELVTVKEGETARYDMRLVAGHEIVGRVVRAGGAPVPEARVTCTPTDIANLRGIGKMVQAFIDQSDARMLLSTGPALTDAVGVFRIPSLEPRLFDLRVEKDGFAWGEVRKVPAGTTGVVVTLQPATHLTGRVLDPDQKAVEGAAVLLREPPRDPRKLNNPFAMTMADIDFFGEKERSATTDGEGRFELFSLRDGKYELVVTAKEYPVRTELLRVEGAELVCGDIVLEAARAIAGRVLAPGGAPIQGAEVFALKCDAAADRSDARRLLEARAQVGEVDSAVSDARGNFRLDRLGTDAYDVVALAPGFVTAVARAVPAGTGGLAIQVSAGLSLAGRVVEADGGRPIAGAKVTGVFDRYSAAETDEDGRFVLRGVDPDLAGSRGDRVLLRLSHDDYQEQVVPVPTPAGNPDPLELVMSRERGVEGVVLDEDGKPVPNARVWFEITGLPEAIMVLSPGGRRVAMTDAEGGFFLPVPRQTSGMNPELVASYPGYAKARCGPLQLPRDPAEWPFFELELSRGGSIEGQVTDVAGAPLAGARVRVVRNVQPVGEAFIFSKMLPPSSGVVEYASADGKYRVSKLEPASYRIEATAVGYAKRVVEPVELTGGTARVDLALDPGGILSGRVVDHESTPVEGVEVVAFLILETRGSEDAESERTRYRYEEEIVKLGGHGTARTTTGEDGVYELSHLPDGEFRVVARAQGFEPDELEGVRSGDVLPDLVVRPFARIVGQVKDAFSGRPIGAFSLRLSSKGGSRRARFGGDWSRGRKLEHPDGIFEYPKVPAGEYELSVVATDYVPATQKVLVESGSESEVVVPLEVGARIEGVVYESGSLEPIAGANLRLWAAERESRYNFDYEDQHQRQTGEDGTFAFGGLEPGKYRVFVTHPDYYLAPNAAVEFEVPLPEAFSLVAPMHPAGRLVGEIRGLPPPERRQGGYEVILTRIEVASREPGKAGGTGRTPEQSASRASSFITNAWVGDDGRFNATGIRPGSYRLELQHRYFRGPDGGPPPDPEKTLLTEVEIRANEVARVDLEAP